MLAPQHASSESACLHGRKRSGLAELRSQLHQPSEFSDRQRRRLQELAQRLARVQARGGEYARVCLSEAAESALAPAAVA